MSSPWMKVGSEGKFQIPANIPGNLPANLPTNLPPVPAGVPTTWGQLGNTPIPKSPYTDGLEGKTPNDIIHAFEDVGHRIQSIPGQVGTWLDEQWNDSFKPMINRYGGVAEIGGALGLGALGLSML